MTKKDKVMEIINDEMAQIRNMIPDKGENEITFSVRKQHYLAELKALKIRIFQEM